MLTMRQIEMFRAVMIAKTVSGAAKMLNISQPGISRMLTHMEDRLQFRLFDRTRGRLLPTQEAQVLFDEIQQIYEGVSGLDNTVRRLAKGEDRLFRIGASPSLGHSVLPIMLARLSANFPGITLQFDILSLEQAHNYLAQQKGEYALTLFPLDHPNVLSNRIAAARLVCAVPASHPLAERDHIRVEDIAGENILSFPPDTPHGTAIAEMFEHAGQDLQVATYVRFAETAVAFVAHGMGVAVVDSFTAMQPHADSVRFLEFEEPGTLPVYLSRNLSIARAIAGETFEEIARLVLQSLPRPKPRQAAKQIEQ
ncbi:LysR family transcriptional regulator [Novosphingobium sp.]|uniref:LysR family transcriptional regulator n=1 Tax=Novosphingobium sp. TaxID=1874826 RepID=UPI0031D813A5